MYADQDNTMDEFDMDKAVMPEFANQTQTNSTSSEGDSIQQVKRNRKAKRAGGEKVKNLG